MPRFVLPLLILSLTGSMTASADDSHKVDDLREAIECFPAEDLIKFFSKFDKLKPEQRDTVDAVIVASFIITDDRGLPQRIFTRDAGVDTSFTLLPDGTIPDFTTITKRSKSSELCMEDQARVGLPRDEDGIDFNVDFDVLYKEINGHHTLEAMKDGAKDGKSFYKKMMPGPAKLLVPKMTHVSITYADERKTGDIQAWNNGQPVDGLIVELFGHTHVVSLKQLEDIGANQLRIEGGVYKLEPSPSIKKMKSLGFSESEGEEEETN